MPGPLRDHLAVLQDQEVRDAADAIASGELRVSRVGLDHHRAARGESARRVVAEDAESKRKVARPEDGDGPERDSHAGEG